jgi:hypothetical protein
MAPVPGLPGFLTDNADTQLPPAVRPQHSWGTRGMPEEEVYQRWHASTSSSSCGLICSSCTHLYSVS